MAFKQECSEQFSFEAPAAAKLTDLRLPQSLTNCVRIQPQCFDSQLYQIEDNVTFKGELGTVITKRCPVTNFIRWRYSKQDGKKDVEAAKLAALGLQVPQSQKMESNARVVQWSDGTSSLAIGDQLFEITKEPVLNTQVFAHCNKLSLLKGNVDDKIIVKPSLRSHSVGDSMAVQKGNDALNSVKMTLAGTGSNLSKRTENASTLQKIGEYSELKGKDINSLESDLGKKRQRE